MLNYEDRPRIIPWPVSFSPRGIIRLMQRMDELVREDGIRSVRFQDTDHYRTTVRFLQNPESAIEDILGIEAEEE